MDINLELLEKQVNKKSNVINNESTSNKESVICLYDFFSSNNIKICEKIKENYYLTENYYIVNEFSKLSISEITDKNIYLNKTLNENNKYVLLQYSKAKYLDFYNFLFNLPNLKLFIFHVLDSYQFLLNSLLKLQEINICFFNLSVKNIIFTKKYKPILQNFSTSLMLNKCDDIDYFLKIIDKIEDYVYKPIEIHVIFYLTKNNEDSLSFYAIDLICNNFIQNMKILSLFSQNFKDNYYKTSINCLKKYINKPKKEIISEILKYSNTWDNYELSILYLHIIGNISRTLSLKDTLINKLTIILAKNISSDPLSRDSILTSINRLDKLFYEYSNWEYINLIPNEKINILYDILLK